MEEAVEVLEKVTGVRTPESKGISLIQLNAQKSAQRLSGAPRSQISWGWMTTEAKPCSDAAAESYCPAGVEKGLELLR